MRSTSSATGASTFSTPEARVQARMLSRCGGEMSDGCQRRAGKARAKNTTCCPVPLATSSTSPAGGSTRRSTSTIGSRLRSVAAACRPPEGTGWGDWGSWGSKGTGSRVAPGLVLFVPPDLGALLSFLACSHSLLAGSHLQGSPARS